MAVRNGIRDLDTIRSIYNDSANMYKNGGDKNKKKESSDAVNMMEGMVRDDTAPMMNNVQSFNGDPSSLIDSNYQEDRINNGAMGYVLPDNFVIIGKANRTPKKKEKEGMPPLPFGGVEERGPLSTKVKRKPVIPEFKPVEFNFNSYEEPASFIMDTPYTDLLMGRSTNGL